MKKNSESTPNNGYDKLLMSYALALEDNSDEIAMMLETLAKKKLSIKDKKQLKSIEKELKRINKSLDYLEGDND